MSHRRKHGTNETCVGADYTDEELAFLKAMDAFKRVVPFPTWCDALRVAKSLGYRKVEHGNKA